ncbi:hypothetical protein PIB30_004532 [Stylosanthes scabra]|uniref:Uncharacterized protein n=1 Tax=Stylosanthes scabra TaxID=79078 RepID=A0ABU6Y3U9_9FABA|nr:hypothetical protein [Stylosanthes scabra]
MEDLSMFQRPRTVALEDENPGTYGTVLIYPLDRLVECGFVGDTAVNPWVGIFCRRQGFARESESLMSGQLTSPLKQVSGVRISPCACSNPLASGRLLNGAQIREGLVFDLSGWGIP